VSGGRGPTALLAAAALILALAWSATLAAWHLAGRGTILDRLEAVLLDLRYGLVGPRPAPDDVVIVALDDDSVRDGGAQPMRRAMLAQLVREVARHRPKAIGLDVLFLDPGPDAEDADLAAALDESDTVIGGAALFPRDDEAARVRDPGDLPVAAHVLRPSERIGRGAGLGLVNVTTDHSGTPRHVPLLVRSEDELRPSFSLRVAARAAGAEPVLSAGRLTLGAAETRPDLGLSLPLRFNGPRGTVRTIPARSVLDGTLRPGELAGRAVVIGATAIGLADTFATPFDPILPGVEVMATAVGHLLTGDGLVRDMGVRRFDVAGAVALASGAALVLALAPTGLAVGLVTLAGVSWLGLTVAAFAAGFWLSASAPLAAMAPVIPLAIVGRHALDRREARRIARARKALGALQAPALARRVASDPTFLAVPEARTASVLFVDLSGFTRLSERLGPGPTQAFLKAFHVLVEDEVARHGGLVTSFMGDGAMAVFGLPDPSPEDAAHALAAALAVGPRVRAWLRERPEGGDVDLRVGAHCGEVVVSRLGGAGHQHITATGDSVNVTSRLLEVGKNLGARLVVSEDLLSAAGAGQVEAARFEGRGDVAIRGRRRPLAVAHGDPVSPNGPERPPARASH
jgi:adenylate cyclase